MLKLVPRVLSAEEIKGNKVRSQEGEEVGKIEDVMVDMATGTIAYAVMGFGGLLGMGNKLVAVPWPALLYDPETQEFEMNVHKDLLLKAPGFDKQNPPQSEDYVWMGELYAYYELPTYWNEPL
jgi:hypothetical protein